MERNYLYHYGILGQKWGVRRYQNSDGSLTEAGKKRYERDILENNAKKKDNRIKDLEETGPDVRRWVMEDGERAKQTIDASVSTVKNLQNLGNAISKRPTTIIDLSAMDDEEMRDQINRKLLERQYTKLLAEESQSRISKGQEYISATMEIAGAVLTTAGSALSIALAIKALRG